MAIKKARKVHESFEDVNGNGRFAKVCHCMMQGKAWQALTLGQMGLYLLLKSKFTKNSTKGTDNRDDISFPKSEWSKLYKTQKMFSRDIDELIAKGFIKVVLYQANIRKPTIYGFSDKWKQYGLETFKIDKREMRPKDTLPKEHKEALEQTPFYWLI